MEEPSQVYVNTIEQEVSWTVSFFRDIQELHHQKEAKVKTVQTLIREVAMISPSSRELLPR